MAVESKYCVHVIERPTSFLQSGRAHAHGREHGTLKVWMVWGQWERHERTITPKNQTIQIEMVSVGCVCVCEMNIFNFNTNLYLIITNTELYRSIITRSVVVCVCVKETR